MGLKFFEDCEQKKKSLFFSTRLTRALPQPVSFLRALFPHEWVFRHICAHAEYSFNPAFYMPLPHRCFSY